MKSDFLLYLLMFAVIFCSAFSRAQTVSRVTVLYDAFGKVPGVTKDWGFSALVEYGGKHILFDTGNNAQIFAGNVKALGVDLKNLDFVVISHRHADHTSGLNHVLSVNPGVTIYAPVNHGARSDEECPTVSIARTIHCLLTCAISTASRLIRCLREVLGPAPTSSP